MDRTTGGPSRLPRPAIEGASARLVELRPPRIAMTLLAAAAAWHWTFPAANPALLTSPVAALGGVGAGFAIMMIGWWQFRQRRIAICPTHETRELIEDGVYRFTRNPMYLGMTAMLAGVALYFGTASFWLAAIVYLVLIDRVFCRYEERKLAAAFGDRYEDYRRRVRRWL